MLHLSCNVTGGLCIIGLMKLNLELWDLLFYRIHKAVRSVNLLPDLDQLVCFSLNLIRAVGQVRASIIYCWIMCVREEAGY